MSEQDWQAGFAKSLGVFLNGDAIPTPNERGERVVDKSFYVMFNAHHEALSLHAARMRSGGRGWSEMLNTSDSDEQMAEEQSGSEITAASEFTVEAWSTRSPPTAGLT